MIYKKKKERTEEEVRRRFKSAFYLMVFMIAVLIFGSITKGVRDLRRGDNSTPVLKDTLDAMLDTCIVSEYGPEACVVKTGQIHRYDVKTVKQKHIDYLANRYEILAKSDTVDLKRLEKTKRELDSLKADPTLVSVIPCYVRVVHYNDGNGYDWAAIQETDTKKTRTALAQKVNLTEKGWKGIEDDIELIKDKLEMLNKEYPEKQ